VLGLKDELRMVLDDDLSDAVDAAVVELAEEFGIDVDQAWEMLQ
jgi:hypothetical protein